MLTYEQKHATCRKTNMHVVAVFDEKCHEKGQTSLIINVVLKRLIQLGYKFLRDNSLTVIFLRESPHHLHTMPCVAPPHVPNVQPIQGATLSVPGLGLRDSAGVLAGNPVEASWRNTWIDWASE